MVKYVTRSMEVIMKHHIIVMLGALLLAGCASEKNIKLNESFWQNKPKVAIAAIKPAKPGMTMQGSQGLLDYAINSAMTKQLDTHLSRTDLTWYYSLPHDLAHKLKERKVPVALLGRDMNDDAKYIANLAHAHQADDILVIKLQAVGVVRRYSGFIPTSSPEAYTVLKGELINTSTNTVKWRHLAEVKLPVQGEWDQPPSYPNLTQAVKLAIATSRQEILDSFFSGQ